MEMHLQVVPQHVPLGGPQVAHQAGIRMLVSHHGGANLLQGKAAEPVSDVQPRGQPFPAPRDSEWYQEGNCVLRKTRFPVPPLKALM